MPAMRYLGVYQGKCIVERDGQLYKQYNDYGSCEVWRQQSIIREDADKIKSRGRDEHDMALVITNKNILKGVKPIWETLTRESLEWHRDNDPSPYSERAAAALLALERGANGER